MVTLDQNHYHNEHLTSLSINREETIGLDSTNAFEGPEKLLEVWFADSPEHLPSTTLPGGLKAVSEERWKEMLDIVRCKVLSVVTSEHVDAYLLSESSMFVFPHKLILKTCGTTTLLHGLPDLLEIAALEAGFHYAPSLMGKRAAAKTYRVFYSRKSFMFPDKQLHPHKSWRDEVEYLDKMFANGSAYMVGKMNGEHWYLYLTGQDQELTPPMTPVSERMDNQGGTETKILHLPTGKGGMDNDETLEILMTDLDPEHAKQFYLSSATAIAEKEYLGTQHAGNSSDDDDGDHNDNNNNCEHHLQASDFVGGKEIPEELTTEGHALGTVVAENCGLADVFPKSKFPEARIDSYLFTPCGFSANAVIPTDKDTHYFTVHVTPEPHCSYASFETNVPGKQSNCETAEVIEHVVDIFRPGRFSVTLFEAKSASGEPGRFAEVSALKRGVRMDKIKGYKRTDRIVHDFEGYDLVFRHYVREDIAMLGPAPAAGSRYTAFEE